MRRQRGQDDRMNRMEFVVDDASQLILLVLQPCPKRPGLRQIGTDEERRRQGLTEKLLTEKFFCQ
jgi:hypothetical protein